MRVSFFFLCAGDRDLERLDREELRRPLELPAGDRDLDLRRPDEELASGLRDRPLNESWRLFEGESRRLPRSGVGDRFERLK